MNPSDVIDARYRLERLLGTGGMAEVWLAEDQRLGRWVALKLLREGFATENDGDLVQGFEREARVVAQLQHPNIVAVYDAGTYEGRYYLVMEYVHGHSLREILDIQGRLREADVLRYGVQSSAGLQFAHDHAVIHCDVKPENILVTEDGTPKLADFGVAETATRTLSPEQAKDILGTIAYLAPEVLQGSGADPRSDVYSLAMTLYEAVAGRLPFAGTNPAALAGQRLATPAPPVRSFARDVSPELEVVLSRGLSLSPHDRYQTAAEFGAALRRVPAHSGRVAGAAGAAVAGATAAAARRPRGEPDTPLRQRNPTQRVRRMPPPPRKDGISGAALAILIAVVFIALGLGLGVAALISQQNSGSDNGTPTPKPTAQTTPTAPPTRPPATATPAPTQQPTATPSPPPSPTKTVTQPPKSSTAGPPTSTKPPASPTAPTPAATVVATPTP